MSNMTRRGPKTAGCQCFLSARGKVPGNVTFMILKVTCSPTRTLGWKPSYLIVVCHLPIPSARYLIPAPPLPIILVIQGGLGVMSARPVKVVRDNPFAGASPTLISVYNTPVFYCNVNYSSLGNYILVQVIFSHDNSLQATTGFALSSRTHFRPHIFHKFSCHSPVLGLSGPVFMKEMIPSMAALSPFIFQFPPTKNFLGEAIAKGFVGLRDEKRGALRGTSGRRLPIHSLARRRDGPSRDLHGAPCNLPLARVPRAASSNRDSIRVLILACLCCESAHLR